MAKTYQNPGVYNEKISILPPKINRANTSIPVFFGFTEKSTFDNQRLIYKSIKINSLGDYEAIFGTISNILVTVKNDVPKTYTITSNLPHRLYHALRFYFDNGGGPCYIVSTGVYLKNMDKHLAYNRFEKALQAVQSVEEPAILVFPDIHLCGEYLAYELYKKALQQCNELKYRFVIIDLYSESGMDKFGNISEDFKNRIGNNHLKYGAAYYPYLKTLYSPISDESRCIVKLNRKNYFLKLPPDAPNLSMSLFHFNNAQYQEVKQFFNDKNVILPPSSAVAGVYCKIDENRGVWKSPANVSLNFVKQPMVLITDFENAEMNVTPSGKSVNAIRSFTGKGLLVWGGRTLAGNDNEWKYITSVRLCSLVEHSITKALYQFENEPNNDVTWKKINVMVEAFLTDLWRDGALQGSSSDKAFYSIIGVNSTMTTQDVLDGKIILHVGLAIVRPAEFLIIRIQKKL